MITGIKLKDYEIEVIEMKEDRAVLSESKIRWFPVDGSNNVSALVLLSGALFLPSVSCSAQLVGPWQKV